MAKRLTPLFARITVQVDTAQQTITQKYAALRKVGFSVPAIVEQKQIPDEGTIVGVGADCAIVKLGDRVLFGKWAAKEIGFAPGHFVMMEEDVIGLITGSDDAAEKVA